ncbi:hypothetical protein DH2020_024268 [Rehmannia glutinosa]|uniref:Uncharacterized protein n=1 Tax=Rehmannia glutinosa TaxID=99300 RepID=A0ABR0WCL5_REHGL
MHQKVDFDTDDDLPIHPNWKSSHVANQKRQNRDRNPRTFGSDADIGFSSGSDDETSRSKKRGNTRGFNGRDSKTGRKSSFRDESFSEADSDDEPSYHRNKHRDNKAGHRGMTAKKSSFNSGFNRSSCPNRNNRGSRENSYNGEGKNYRESNASKFRSPRQGGSFDKRKGRSNNFDNQPDSYMDDERSRRPRINVR